MAKTPPATLMAILGDNTDVMVKKVKMASERHKTDVTLLLFN